MRELFTRVADGEPVAYALRGLNARGLKLANTRAHELLRKPFYAGFNVLDDGREKTAEWDASLLGISGTVSSAGYSVPIITKTARRSGNM